MSAAGMLIPRLLESCVQMLINSASLFHAEVLIFLDACLKSLLVQRGTRNVLSGFTLWI